MTSSVFKKWARRLAATVLAVFAGATLHVPEALAAAAPAWIVDRAASRLQFQSSAAGMPFTGAFGRWGADIHFDPKNLPGSSVTVRIDMASARTGASDKDEALPGADWFATAKFAQASFVAKSFKDLGGGRYQAIGALTIRGVTRPITVSFQLAIKGAQARMNGSATVDRHLFGVGQGQFSAADAVPFDVKILIALSAKRG